MAIAKGMIDWQIAAPVAAGTVLGIVAARKAAHHITHAHVHNGFAVMALLVAIGLLVKSVV